MMKNKFRYFFISFFLLFSLSAFGSNQPQTCTWTDNLGPDPNTGITKTAQVTTRRLSNNADGTATYETCAQATARKQHQVDRGRANRNAFKTITGGSRHACNWTSPNLPNAPSQTYTLEQRKIGEDANGNPQYESCATAQRRRQAEWLDYEFAGHREDAEAAIAAEQQRLQQEAEQASLSASEEADRAARKQQNTSMVTGVGAMAAGAAAAACCSSTTCGACGYLVALSAGLGIASMITGNASSKNRGISSEYTTTGGLMSDPYNPGGTTDYTPAGITDGITDGSTDGTTNGTTGITDGTTDGTTGLTDGSVTDGGLTDGSVDGGGLTDGATNGSTDGSTDGNTTGIRVVDGGADGGLGGGGITPPGFDFTPSPWEDNAPTIRLPNGDIVKASPKHIGPYLKKKGLKWDPKKGKITLPNGQSYSADDADKFKNQASSGPAAALKGQMAGLAKQIDAASGGATSAGDGILGDAGGSSGKSGVGGGGFSGYAKGSGGGKNLMASLGPGQSSAGGSGGGKDPSNMAGMSVKHGKNRVGVSQDNIFEIIHRRYQAKRKRQHFIEIGK